MLTDLLERPQCPFHPVRKGIDLFPRPQGFGAVQWEP